MQLFVKLREEMLYGIVHSSKKMFAIGFNVVLDDKIARVSFE